MEESDIIALFTAAVIFLFIFGSITGVGIPLAALIAVLVSALGILFYLGIFDLLSVSEMVPSLVSMLGIGICADYNLLLLSRFREEMNNGVDSVTAASKSIQTAGKTVIFSGFTVMTVAFEAQIPEDGGEARTASCEDPSIAKNHTSFSSSPDDPPNRARQLPQNSLDPAIDPYVCC